MEHLFSLSKNAKAFIAVCGALTAAFLLAWPLGAFSSPEAHSAQASDVTVQLSPVKNSFKVTPTGIVGSNEDVVTNLNEDKAAADPSRVTITNTSSTDVSEAQVILTRKEGRFDGSQLMVTKKVPSSEEYTLLADGSLELTVLALAPGESNSFDVSSAPAGLSIDKGHNVNESITASVSSVDGLPVTGGSTDTIAEEIPVAHLVGIDSLGDGKGVAFHLKADQPVDAALAITAPDGGVIAECKTSSPSIDPVCVMRPNDAAASAALSRALPIATSAGFFDSLKAGLGKLKTTLAPVISKVTQCAKDAFTGFVGGDGGSSGGIVGALCTAAGAAGKSLLGSSGGF